MRDDAGYRGFSAPGVGLLVATFTTLHLLKVDRRNHSADILVQIVMLKSHKRAIAGIKSAQQRVAKATEERDKQKEKLKRAEARLKAEKENLRTNQEKLES